MLDLRDKSVKPEWGATLDPSHPLTQDMLCCYLLNEATGAVFYDAAGKLSPFAGGVAVPWAAGTFGPGLKFSGSQWAEIVKPLLVSGPFTVSILVAPSVKASSWAWTHGTAASGSVIGIGTNSTGVFRWEISGASIVGTVAFTLNALYRLTLTYDPGRTNKVLAYVNTTQDVANTGAASFAADRHRIGATTSTAAASFYSLPVHDEARDQGLLQYRSFHNSGRRLRPRGVERSAGGWTEQSGRMGGAVCGRFSTSGAVEGDGRGWPGAPGRLERQGYVRPESAGRLDHTCRYGCPTSSPLAYTCAGRDDEIHPLAYTHQRRHTSFRAVERPGPCPRRRRDRPGCFVECADQSRRTAPSRLDHAGADSRPASGLVE
jgi:hypothetical protein